jgi:hypothetical protein
MAHSIKAARLAKRRARAPGDLRQLLLVLWGAIREAEDILYSAKEEEVDLRLRAVHALSQASSVYARVLQGEAMEARIEALESSLSEQAA